MNFTMITPHHNHDAGYISLVDIELANLPDTISVNGMTLLRKNEFHLSLLSLKLLGPMLDKSDDELEAAFLEYQANHNLTDFTLTNTFRLVRRGDKATIVVMVDMPSIEGLFDFLRHKYDVEIPTQPTHITLYALQPEVGIGLLSQEEIKAESVSVQISELENIKVSKNV